MSTFPRSHYNSREHGYTLVPEFSFSILIMCIFITSLLLSFPDLLLFISFSLFFHNYWFLLICYGMGIVIGFVKTIIGYSMGQLYLNNAKINLSH